MQDFAKEDGIKGENIMNGKNPETINFISEVAMPHGGIRTKEWKFDFTDWAKFLGWYVSEGSVYKEKRNYGRYRIMIAQKKERNKEVIRHLLHKMGITFIPKGDAHFMQKMPDNLFISFFLLSNHNPVSTIIAFFFINTSLAYIPSKEFSPVRKVKLPFFCSDAAMWHCNFRYKVYRLRIFTIPYILPFDSKLLRQGL